MEQKQCRALNFKTEVRGFVTSVGKSKDAPWEIYKNANLDDKRKTVY